MSYVYDGEESVFVVGTEENALIKDYRSLYSDGRVLLVYVHDLAGVTEMMNDARCRIGLVLEDIDVDYATVAKEKEFYILVAGSQALHDKTGAVATLEWLGATTAEAHARIIMVAQYFELLKQLGAL